MERLTPRSQHYRERGEHVLYPAHGVRGVRELGARGTPDIAGSGPGWGRGKDLGEVGGWDGVGGCDVECIVWGSAVCDSVGEFGFGRLAGVSFCCFFLGYFGWFVYVSV